jgi:hypothetical protein
MPKITYAACLTYFRQDVDEAGIAERVGQLQHGQKSLLTSDKPKTYVQRTLQPAHSAVFLTSINLALARSRATTSDDAHAAAASHGTKRLEGLMLRDLATMAKTVPRRLSDAHQREGGKTCL